MRLLKKGVPFFWDEAAQHSFEALKCALTSAPLLQPPNYNKYFLLYLFVTHYFGHPSDPLTNMSSCSQK
jgi:hypothetical protein